MSLGGSVLKQHVVEFIRGTGVKTDGVVNATSTNGPWTWAVPDGVSQLMLDGTGAGCSGWSGGNGTPTQDGGQGGLPAAAVVQQLLSAVPGASLTITLGSGGVSAAAGGNVNGGGNTTIAGVLPNFYNATTVTLQGGGAYNCFVGSPSASPGEFIAGAYRGYTASTGGAGNATGSVAGANGGAPVNYAGSFFSNGSYAPAPTGGTGNTTGSVSRGGGGAGGSTPFGIGGNGGNGGAAGTAAGGYGAGGGGGGGGAASGAGTDGYVRFTYWSAD